MKISRSIIGVESLTRLGSCVLVVNRADTVQWVSECLNRRLGPDCVGRNLESLAVPPDRPVVSLALTTDSEAVFPLRGVWLPWGSEGSRVFVGSPAPETNEEMTRLGVRIDDFLEHDAWLNYLILSDEASTTQKDAVTRIHQLKQERAKLSEAHDQMAKARKATLNIMLDLEEAKAAAEAATRAKSDFLASMSHELRTPLNGVIGMTELLTATKLDAQQQEFVDACQSSGRSLLALINDILDFSKIEAGKLQLEEHEFDLVKLVEEMTTAMAFTAGRKGIGLFNRTSFTGGRTVRGDSGRLRQVLVNLVGNAIKFTEEGEVVVRVKPVEDGEKEKLIRFEVSDTGIGIAPDVVQTLFESFSQADTSTTRKYGGTGLGLAISRRLAELMGGRMGVESEVGRGSTFWFEVPLVPCRGGNLVDLEAEERPQPVSGLAGKRVLLAEDNRINRLFAGHVLKEAGMECDCVVNGKEALAAVRSHAYDLILMDCQMPEMDGFEATRAIRHMERDGELAGNVTIIALTANAIRGDRDQCLEAGMDDYLSKPFAAEQLIRLIAERVNTESRSPSTRDDDQQPSSAPACSTVPGGLPPINHEELLQRCMGSLDFAEEILSDFAADLPTGIEAVSRSIAESDAQGVREAAHALKGAAGIVGAGEVRRVTAALESAGRSGRLEDAAALLDELNVESRRFLDAVPRVRKELTSSPCTQPKALATGVQNA